MLPLRLFNREDLMHSTFTVRRTLALSLLGFSFCGGVSAQCPSDDASEPNDSCGAAIPLATGLTTGLVASDASPDYWQVVVPDGEQMLLTLSHNPASSDLSVFLFDTTSPCININAIGFAGTLSGGNTTSYANGTGASVTIAIAVQANGGGACGEYGLEIEFVPNPFLCTGVADDAFEPNDDCLSAVPLTVGNYPDLNVGKQGIDEDWFAIEVLPLSVLSIVASIGFADIDIELYDACGGTLLSSGTNPGFREQVNFTNSTGSPVTVYLTTYVWSADSYSCGDYDLSIDFAFQEGNLVSFCEGDGSGVACPCGNNSSLGHGGGCAHGAGDGAVLQAMGTPSVANNTISLQVGSASPNSFVLLVSGINPLPQQGACTGCGVPAFDGLRCAGGSFLRHGTRATDASGTAAVGWVGSLFGQSTFSPGETRHFFAFFRSDLATGCNTGQNSSNGLRVTYLP